MERDYSDLEFDESEAVVFLGHKLRALAGLEPLLEAYPLLAIEDAPENLRNEAIDRNLLAVNDGRHVYYNLHNFHDWLKFHMNGDVIRDEVKNFIDTEMATFSFEIFAANQAVSCVAQQYLHLLLQHTRATRYFDSENLDLKIFRIATEIEVNRSVLVDRYSVIYNVTPNTSLYPETSLCQSLRETYAALLQQKENEEEEQESDSPEEKEESQSDSSDGEGEQDNNSQDSVQKPSDKQTKSSQSEKVSRAQAEANMTPQQNLLETDDDLVGDPSEASKLKKFQVAQLIEAVYERWHNKLVRREMRKLRGVLQGEISRKKRHTYARPSRRHIQATSLLKKGVAHDLSGQPKILVALDTSGSMQMTKLEDMLTAVANTFADLGRPTKGCWVCLFNDDIVAQVPLRRYKDIIGNYRPFGGTGYCPVMELADSLDVDVVIEIGDGQQHIPYHTYQDYMSSKGRLWYDLLINTEDLDYSFSTHILPDLDSKVERHVLACTKEAAEVTHRYAQVYPEYKKFLR